jgi:hypothetical protein
MTAFESLDAFNNLMVCGTPTITPRLEAAPVRVPTPLPEQTGSIYEIQKGLKARAFESIDE